MLKNYFYLFPLFLVGCTNALKNMKLSKMPKLKLLKHLKKKKIQKKNLAQPIKIKL